MNIEHPASELGAELVFGDEPIDDEHLEGLRREIAGLRADYAVTPAPEPRADLAQLFEPDTENAPAAVIPLRSGTSAGRRPVRLARRLAIAAAAVVGAAALTTGLAAADVLPGPVQQAVHDVLSHAGVNVPPSNADDHPAPAPTVPSTVAAGAPDTGAPTDTASGATPSPTGSPSAPPVTVASPPVTAPGAGTLPPPLGGLGLPGLPALTPPSTSPSPPSSTTTPGLTLPPVPPLPPLTLPHLPPLLP
jgi:hypothetical protein